jgi:hypothetical protein
MKSIKEKEKVLGLIYEDFLVMEKEPLCSRAAVYVRSNGRYEVMTQMAVELECWPEDEEVGEDTVEPGEYISKVRGGVSWYDHDGFPTEVIFEQWGRTVWLESLDLNLTRYGE